MHKPPSKQAQEEEVLERPRPPSHKNDTSDSTAITRRALMLRMYTRTRRDVKNVEIQITLKVSSVQRSFNASLVISMSTS